MQETERRTYDRLDELAVNGVRILAVDMVEEAGSGHPGAPLGAAPMAYVLWSRFLRHNPRNPDWPDRDRFVLSAGHASALLYSLLHLTGYDLPLEELRRFRQLGSHTPGHPEYRETPGVEATTGPLGQGFGMSVGMALAEHYLGTCFNQPGHPVVDHHTYALVSDGDLMEGIASEAASVAGTLGLGKLICLYDDNHISIEGGTDQAFTEDVRKRFEAQGWQVLRVPDGEDLEAIDAAVREARDDEERPSLVMVRTRIGFGSPKAGTAEVHGEPLGPDGVGKTREALGWPDSRPFAIPEEALSRLRRAVDRGAEHEGRWRRTLEDYRTAHADLAREFEEAVTDGPRLGREEDLPRFRPEEGPIHTRGASGDIMNAVARQLRHFIGGSADLSPSTKTQLIGYGDFGFDRACARNLHFGVREHAMGAIVNGMALHGGVIPYAATFFVFSDYMRPALRLSALMGVPSIFVFTHDSIALGEDGPTHQPVEQLASLRAMPGFTVLRPADANETTEAWKLALRGDRGPTALVLTRQKVPVLDPDEHPLESGVHRGAYILEDAPNDEPDVVLLASGSEVHLVRAARDALAERGVQARAVSMPSWELFREQPPDYRRQVLPHGVPRLAVEAGASQGWREWVGDAGDVVALDRFGASGPGPEVYEHLGFHTTHVVDRALALLEPSAATAPGRRSR